MFPSPCPPLSPLSSSSPWEKSTSTLIPRPGEMVVRSARWTLLEASAAVVGGGLQHLWTACRMLPQKPGLLAGYLPLPWPPCSGAELLCSDSCRHGDKAAELTLQNASQDGAGKPERRSPLLSGSDSAG